MRNSFGSLFRITTWGESHGKAIGVVIDGCPSQIEISEEEINQKLQKRRPGSKYTSSRKEKDKVKLLSGVFKGKTTGCPISLIIENTDFDSSKYEKTKDILTPSHAKFSYLEKYKIFDYLGSGRASARETAARVAAAAIAEKILEKEDITVLAYVESIGDIKVKNKPKDIFELKKSLETSQIFCSDRKAEKKMILLLQKLKKEKDSIGGVVSFLTSDLPKGLGEPVFDKISSRLASGLMSIPGSKGFEIGNGFEAATLKGSENNDLFISERGKIRTKTNRAGGVIGGLTSGMPIFGKVAFKPTPTIGKKQKTVTKRGKKATFELQNVKTHDPCIAIRATAVVEAMIILSLADMILLNKTARLI